jgi:hypothetical protein
MRAQAETTTQTRNSDSKAKQDRRSDHKREWELEQKQHCELRRETHELKKKGDRNLETAKQNRNNLQSGGKTMTYRRINGLKTANYQRARSTAN